MPRVPQLHGCRFQRQTLVGGGGEYPGYFRSPGIVCGEGGVFPATQMTRHFHRELRTYCAFAPEDEEPPLNLVSADPSRALRLTLNAIAVCALVHESVK